MQGKIPFAKAFLSMIRTSEKKAYTSINSLMTTPCIQKNKIHVYLHKQVSRTPIGMNFAILRHGNRWPHYMDRQSIIEVARMKQLVESSRSEMPHTW
jgi:hypothetical protein